MRFQSYISDAKAYSFLHRILLRHFFKIVLCIQFSHCWYQTLNTTEALFDKRISLYLDMVRVCKWKFMVDSDWWWNHFLSFSGHNSLITFPRILYSWEENVLCSISRLGSPTVSLQYIYIVLFVFSFCEEWPIAEHPEKEAAMDLVEFRQKNPESLNDCVEQSVPGSLYWTSAYEK